MYLTKAVLVHPLLWKHDDDDTDSELAFARLTAAYRHFAEGSPWHHSLESRTDATSRNDADFAAFRFVAQSAIEANDLDPGLCASCRTILNRQQALGDGDVKDEAPGT